MNEPFPFDLAYSVARGVLLPHKEHEDFDDILAEAVIATWQAKQRHPELPIKHLATKAARWQWQEWFRSSRCGDVLSGRNTGARIRVGQMAEWADQWLLFADGMDREQYELSMIWRDFFASGVAKPHHQVAIVLIYQYRLSVTAAARLIGIAPNSLTQGIKIAFRRYREKVHAESQHLD
jgi:hypothetical protein